MNQTVLAADIGTSSVKAAVVAAEGQIVAVARSASYPTQTPQNGWTEQDPHAWLTAYREVIATLAGTCELQDVAALVLTGQMSAGLLVDAQVRPLTPCLIWSDQRASAQAAAAEKSFGAEAIYRLTGNPAGATYTAPKIAWLKQHAPAAYEAASAFAQPKDWVVAQLTGELKTDCSDASCTGLLDIKQGSWVPELFAAYGIDQRLAPEVLASTTAAGLLKADVATELGLPAGIPVLGGGGDGPATAAGAGALQPGDGYASLGTSAWISFASADPALDPASKLANFSHVIPGLVVETGAMQAAGGALEWAADLLGVAPDELATLALTKPPAVDGPLFLPYLQGERTPLWFSASGGTFLGLGRAHERAEIAAAVLEGVLFQLRMILATFAALGSRTACLTVAGSFGRSASFGQRLADTLGQPVRLLANAEHATAIGAAMLGFTNLGVFASAADAQAWIAYEDTCTPTAATELAQQRYAIFADSWPAVSAPTLRLSELSSAPD